MMVFRAEARSQEPSKILVEPILDVSQFDKDRMKHTSRATSHILARKTLIAPVRRQPCWDNAPKSHIISVIVSMVNGRGIDR